LSCEAMPRRHFIVAAWRLDESLWPPRRTVTLTQSRLCGSAHAPSAVSPLAMVLSLSAREMAMTTAEPLRASTQAPSAGNMMTAARCRQTQRV
jgi:hypothetical protein